MQEADIYSGIDLRYVVVAISVLKTVFARCNPETAELRPFDVSRSDGALVAVRLFPAMVWVSRLALWVLRFPETTVRGFECAFSRRFHPMLTF